VVNDVPVRAPSVTSHGDSCAAIRVARCSLRAFYIAQKVARSRFSEPAPADELTPGTASRISEVERVRRVEHPVEHFAGRSETL